MQADARRGRLERAALLIHQLLRARENRIRVSFPGSRIQTAIKHESTECVLESAKKRERLRTMMRLSVPGSDDAMLDAMSAMAVSGVGLRVARQSSRALECLHKGSVKEV